MRKIIAIAFIALFMAAGCKHTEYITVPEYHERIVNKTDTVHITDSVRESKTSILQEVDSSFLAGMGIIRPPKTAYLLKEVHDRQEKSSLNHISRDTLIERDTIRVPYPVEKRVEVNVLYWWQKTLMYGGTAAILAVIIWIARVLKRK